MMYRCGLPRHLRDFHVLKPRVTQQVPLLGRHRALDLIKPPAWTSSDDDLSQRQQLARFLPCGNIKKRIDPHDEIDGTLVPVQLPELAERLNRVGSARSAQLDRRDTEVWRVDRRQRDHLVPMQS